MKIFVTGGTGFIGRALVNALLVRGHRITVLVRQADSAQARMLGRNGVEVAPGDVTDRASLRAAMAGAEVVIHNAGINKLGLSRADTRRMTEINVNGTANTLGLAYELKIPRILYVSSAFALGETDGNLRDEDWVRHSPPRSHFEATKAQAHALAVELQRAGAPILIFCPVAVAGPGDKSSLGAFARLYVRNQMPPILFGDGTMSFVHVDDVAAALTHSVERGEAGQTYLLSSGPLSLREMVDHWQTTPGGANRVWWWLPRWLALRLCAIAEPVQRVLRLPVLFSKELARSAYLDMQYSGAKAARELGIKLRPPRQVWRDTLNSERKRWLG